MRVLGGMALTRNVEFCFMSKLVHTTTNHRKVRAMRFSLVLEGSWLLDRLIKCCFNMYSR